MRLDAIAVVTALALMRDAAAVAIAAAALASFGPVVATHTARGGAGEGGR